MAIQVGKRLFPCLVGAGLLPLVAVACGSTNNAPSTFVEDAGAGPSNELPLAPPPPPTLNETTSDAGLPRPDEDAATCAESSQAATQKPLDLVFMIDTSGSMEFKVASGATKWDAVKSALTKFFADGRSEGLGVQLQYFPTNKPGVPATCSSNAQCDDVGAGGCLRRMCTGLTRAVLCDADTECQAYSSRSRCRDMGYCPGADEVCFLGGTCTSGVPCAAFAAPMCTERVSCGEERGGSVYAKPAVAYSALPAGNAAIAASLTAQIPAGGTPTRPAMEGLVTQAKALAEAKPEHTVVSVLVTDGLPTLCAAPGGAPTDIQPVVAAAKAANESARIPTYVLGVFAPEEKANAQKQLDAVASAGGTTKAFLVGTDQDVAGALVAELGRIRNSLLGCDYDLPDATGKDVDYRNGRVKVTLGAGETRLLDRVSAEASCGAEPAFYFDVDPARGTPKKAHLCKSACDPVKADPKAKVEVLLGCRAVVPIR